MTSTQDCDSGQCPPAENALDPKTFTPPVEMRGNSLSQTPSIIIEFCNRCRWLHRATWVQTELFLTFPDALETAPDDGEEQQQQQQGSGKKYETAGKGLKAITLVPCNSPETGGRFRVWLCKGEGDGAAARQGNEEGVYQDGRVVLLWDRKIKSGFPELRELKQLIRDEIAPAHRLGHSDRKTT